MSMPLVNLGYDMFFGEPPEPQQLEKMLNVISLVGALLLAAVVAVPSGVDFNELQTAYKRGLVTNFTEWSFCSHQSPELTVVDHCRMLAHQHNGYAIDDTYFWYVIGFGPWCSVTLLVLSTSLLMDVVLLLCYSATSFKLNGSFSHALFKVWWRYARWVFMASFLLLVAGIAAFFFVMHRLLMIKVPDLWMEARNQSDYAYGPFASTMSGYFYGIWIGIGIWFMGIIGLSTALTEKEKLSARLHAQIGDDAHAQTTKAPADTQVQPRTNHKP